MVRQKIFSLEQAHMAIKQRFVQPGAFAFSKLITITGTRTNWRACVMNWK